MCVKIYLICFYKEYLDLKNKFSELRNRERFLLERRIVMYLILFVEFSFFCIILFLFGVILLILSFRSSFVGSDYLFLFFFCVYIRVYFFNY